jgi:hypothetical protein
MVRQVSLKTISPACLARLAFVLTCVSAACGQSVDGAIRGIIRDPGGLLPLPQAQVIVRKADDSSSRTAISSTEGSFVFANPPAGRYQLEGKKDGFANSRMASFELAAGQSMSQDVTLGTSVSSKHDPKKTDQRVFFYRFVKAYTDDWKETSDPAPDAKRRGFPAPVDGPPDPFSDWPYGGSVVIGAP